MVKYLIEAYTTDDAIAKGEAEIFIVKSTAEMATVWCSEVPLETGLQFSQYITIQDSDGSLSKAYICLSAIICVHTGKQKKKYVS